MPFLKMSEELTYNLFFGTSSEEEANRILNSGFEFQRGLIGSGVYLLSEKKEVFFN